MDLHFKIEFSLPEKDVLFLVNVFRFHSGLKLRFTKITVRKNLFLSVCSYGVSHLGKMFRFSKLFRLHAILHDAACAVHLLNGKGPGHCYKISRGPIWCLLRHVTLEFSIVLLETVSSLHFHFSRLLVMSLLVSDIDFAEKNVVKEMGVFILGEVIGSSLKPPKMYQPTHHTLW